MMLYDPSNGPLTLYLNALNSTILFVATTGNDSTGTGSLTAPYLTLSKALTVATSGQTIMMRGGTYSIGASMNITSTNNNCVVMSYPQETAILDGGGTLDPILTVNAATNVSLVGLQFQNGKSASYFYGAIQFASTMSCNILACYFTTVAQAVYLNQSGYSLIQGNYIYNTYSAGIAGSGYCETIDSNIFDTMPPASGFGTNGGGIYCVNTSTLTITHNIFRHIQAPAISLQNSGGGCNNGHVIQYNKATDIMNNASITDCGVCYLDNQSVTTNLSSLIDTNYFVAALQPTSGTVSGIYLDDNTSNVVVTNNIVEAGNFGIHIHGGSGNLVQNNIINMKAFSSGTNFGAGFVQGNGATMTGNCYYGNIVYSTAATAPGVWVMYGTGAAAACSGNFYYNTNSQVMTNTNGLTDASPHYTSNPLFTSAATGVYSMGNLSAPLVAGFTGVNQGLIGLRPNGYLHWPTNWS